MLELRLAGIHDDGENLVLESADGASYLLPIDQNLRQSIAKARRISPLRTGGNGTFGPRDIQTRFRQGATVEEISAESGWEPERVRRYEWPIVAERANIIHTARRTVISATPGGSAPAQNLNQLIEAAGEKYGFIDSPMDWSTWQQESGQWTVALDIAVGESVAQGLPRGVMFPARWTFNPANQSIYASNEAAYFLMGRDNSKDSPIPSAPSAETPAQEEEAPQLTAVRVPENKEQNELLDELNARRGVRSFDPASERKLADLLERARRGSRPVGAEGEEDVEQIAEPAHEEQAPVASASVLEGDETAVAEVAPAVEPAPVEVETSDEIAVEIATEQVVAEAPATDVAETEEAEKAELAPEAVEPVAAADEEEQGEAVAEPEAVESAEQGEEQENRPRSQRGKRTSVPSWDDIIFGNQRR